MKTVEVEVGFTRFEVIFGENGEIVVMDGVTGDFVSPYSHTGKLAISLAKDKLEGEQE